MFEYFKGTLIEASPLKAIIDVSGVGYSLWIPLSHYAKLPQAGGSVFFYLSQVIREDSHSLYGFLTRSERDLFESLTAISGVGPKTALALIGHMEGIQLQLALSQGDTTSLSKIPGIGKKTAERLIIEMRDKIKKFINQDTSSSAAPLHYGIAADALSALVNLGYNHLQAQKAVQKVLSRTDTPPSLSELITASLRSF